MPKIRFRRGKETDLPKLEQGEPGFTTDTDKLFIGGNNGNVELSKKEQIDDLQEQINSLDGELAETTGRLDGDISATNTRIDDLKKVDANAEVLAARGTFPLLGDRLNDVTASLADMATKKADKTYVDTQLSNVGNGSPKGVYATLTALQSAYPTGTTGIYVVTADGKWYFWSGSAWTAGGTYQSTEIADKSVTLQKTSFVDVTMGTNLFDKSVATASRVVVQENGTLVTLSGYTASDYMAVLPGDTIKTTPARDGAWYDGNKTYISGIVSGTATALTLTAPANAKFMRITFENAYVDTAMVTKNTLPGSYVPYTAPSMQITDQSFKDALNQNTNAYLTNNNLLQPSKWKNKVWSVIGDSITEVNAKTTKNYHGYIKDKINCTVNNYGLSGTGWIVPYTTGPAFYNRTSNVDINSDLITVFGGTNDWGRTDANTFPFGALGDTTSATFYGAVDLTLSNLINRFPTKMIAVILPLPRVGGYSANSRGETLDQYANAIKEVANKYCIPVLDLYRESNFYVRNSTFNSTFMPDGLHPNDAGHQLIADKILAFLNAL